MPNFNKIAFNRNIFKPMDSTQSDETWETLEKISVKSVYSAADVIARDEATEGAGNAQFASGLPPFLRGPYSLMYVTKPWTIRQYAGFSTAEASNAF